MFMLALATQWLCFYLCPATPGRLNDLVMSRVVDLRSVTFLVGLARIYCNIVLTRKVTVSKLGGLNT